MSAARHYGVVGSTIGEAADPAPTLAPTLALEEIARNGLTVLEGAVAPEPAAAMRAALDRILAAQTARFGAERLRAIGDADTARALLEEDALFLELLRLPRLDVIVTALLGPAALVTQQNGIVMPGGGATHNQQGWHRDLPYQHWVASKPLALGALLALDAFTEESGATQFLPGSHRHEDFPSDAYAVRWARPVLAPAGSIIVFDAMVYHRGGVNRGAAPRRAVNTVFGVPLLAQQVAFTDRPGLDALLRRRLGLDYRASPGADAWREARAARLGQ